MARAILIGGLFVCALGMMVSCGEDGKEEREEILISGVGETETEKQVNPQRIRIEIGEINFDAKGNDWDNLNDEWVVLVNKGKTPVNMIGYTLSDDSGHVYEFGNFILPVDGHVKISTGSGVNTVNWLYWGSDAPIWNNGGDVASLKNPEGILVSQAKW